MYNIRVYGLLIENDAVLVSDELYNGIYMTKFPGGGHHIGESLIDCLHREFKEELDLKIEIKSHFYTTDFYVPSFFNPKDQLISIYFLIERDANTKLKTSQKKFDFEPIHGAQSLRWLPLSEINEMELSYPIDKKVVTMLKNSCYL
jgi:ADP-ribose pyrophosphatase YjhB (NUDIX family)